MKHLTLISLALVALAGAAAAAPPPSPPVPTRIIAYSDLDLQDPADAAVMLHRIRLAADQVCRVPGGNRANEIEAFIVCHAASVERAVRQLDAQLVTSAYAAKRANRRLAQLD